MLCSTWHCIRPCLLACGQICSNWQCAIDGNNSQTIPDSSALPQAFRGVTERQRAQLVNMSLCSQAELSYIICKSPLMAFCMHMPIFIYSYTGVHLHCSTIAIGLDTPFSLNKPRLQVSTRHHLRSCFSQVYTVQKAVQWPRSTLCSIIASMRKKLLKVCRNRCEQSTEKACCVGQQALTKWWSNHFYTHISATNPKRCRIQWCIYIQPTGLLATLWRSSGAFWKSS